MYWSAPVQHSHYRCTGPHLFNTHITDVPGSTDNISNVTLPADDTGTLISNNCYEEMNRNFNEVLYNSLKWFKENQLVLNMEMTKTVKSNSANFPHSALHIAFTDHLPGEN
jgi:hypothetical protein